MLAAQHALQLGHLLLVPVQLVELLEADNMTHQARTTRHGTARSNLGDLPEVKSAGEICQGAERLNQASWADSAAKFRLEFTSQEGPKLQPQTI